VLERLIVFTPGHAALLAALHDNLPAILALAVAAAFACGLRPFAVAFCLGAAGRLGWLELPAGLELLQTGLPLFVCGAIAIAERMADALALHGHDEDLLLSGLRIPLGAVVLAAWLVDALGAWGWLALPVGALLAAGGQALKAALRAMGGLLGWRRTLSLVTVSIDIFVPLSLALAWNWPVLALAVLSAVLFVALPVAIWWVRELRSRWRRWAAMSLGPSR
jgi:hypothetical protein